MAIGSCLQLVMFGPGAPANRVSARTGERQALMASSCFQYAASGFDGTEAQNGRHIGRWPVKDWGVVNIYLICSIWRLGGKWSARRERTGFGFVGNTSDGQGRTSPLLRIESCSSCCILESPDGVDSAEVMRSAGVNQYAQSTICQASGLKV